MLEEQQVFAQDQLDSTAASIEDWQSELASARTRQVAATESLAGLLTEEALRQLDVWVSSSQSTLVSTPPGQTPNAQANFQMAQSAARETLVLTERARDLSGDLLADTTAQTTGSMRPVMALAPGSRL